MENGFDKIVINTEGFFSGIYFIQVSNSSEVFTTQKIIID